MGLEVHAELQGLDELASGVDALIETMHGEAEREFKATADNLAGIVAGRVPIVSGALAGSVRSEERAAGAAVTMGGMGVPYAGWIEFGGSRGRPYYPEGRYLMPTIDEAHPDIVEAGTRAAETAIERTTWPSP